MGLVTPDVTFLIIRPRLEAKFVRKYPHFTLDAMTPKGYDSVPLESMFVRKYKLDANDVQKL
jgi:hypothetical protein